MMTLQQATNLTVKAMEIAQGGEIFVLKMPVVLLRDLAEVIIDLSAKCLSIQADDIIVQEIGLRPGEKMYEELMTMEEAKGAYELPDMFVIPNSFLNKELVYPGALKTDKTRYSSDDVSPVNKSELLSMLQSNGLC